MVASREVSLGSSLGSLINRSLRLLVPRLLVLMLDSDTGLHNSSQCFRFLFVVAIESISFHGDALSDSTADTSADKGVSFTVSCSKEISSRKLNTGPTHHIFKSHRIAQSVSPLDGRAAVCCLNGPFSSTCWHSTYRKIQ